MFRHSSTWSRALIVALAFPVAVALLVGCGGSGSRHASGKPSVPADVSPAGDIPDTQAFVTFMSPDGTFSLKVPEGWSRAQAGSSTVFIDKFNSVRVETATVPSPPTVASATAVEVPAIAAATPGFKLGTVSTVRRSAGDAVLVTYRADSTTDAVTGRSVRLEVERYEFAKNGQQATLTLSAPVGADNVDPWKTITNSFGWAA